ncbi:MAG: protein translocase subunit SecD, partial [Pseudolysinimonas sp.]
MATKSSTPVRKAGRSLAWLGAIIVVLAGIIGGGVLWAGWSPTPKLALDLEGGTQIILEPIVVNGQDPSTEQLTQAVSIIRQRVDYAGTSEAEIGLLGKNIVVSIPGIPDQATLDRIQAASKLEFRPVLLAGQPSNSSIGATPSPTDSASP